MSESNVRHRLHRAMQYLGLESDPRAQGRDGGALRSGGRPGAGEGGAGADERPGARLRRQVDDARAGDDLIVLVVFVPEGSSDAVRDAAARAGAGAIGDYRACSFSVRGQGRFEPLDGANPAIGVVGRPEVVEEQRVEVICPRRTARTALDAMLAVHPYEEPAWHAYRTLSKDELAW